MSIRPFVPVLLAGQLVCSVGCESAQPTTAPTPSTSRHLQVGENVAELRVNGMSCPLCANNITQQLRLIRGVEQVEIDLGRGIVLVGVSPERRPTPAQFKAAVAASSFTLVDLNVPWAAKQAETQPAETQPASP